MAEQESVSALLSNAYESLRSVDLPGATTFLDRALDLDFEDSEVLWSLKCRNFWAERAERIEGTNNLFERGEYIVAQWKRFVSFASKLEGDFERGFYAYKRFAFSLARAVPGAFLGG